MSSLLTATAIDFLRCWKPLFLTDVVYKVIAFIVLTPLVTITFQLFVSYSGNTVLADQDVLFFFLSPWGLACLIVVSALWIGILALEQTACLAILATPATERPDVVSALRFAASNAWRVNRLTGLLVGASLLTLLPFMIVAAVLYLWLLTEFDINYYLTEQPPVFRRAVGMGVVLAVCAAALLLRLVAGWFFALPLVVFQPLQPRAAMAESRRRARGHRGTILLAVLLWLTVAAAISSLATAITIAIGRLLVPNAAGSLATLTVAIGGCLLVWFVVTLLINLISTTTLAALLWNAFQQFGATGRSALVRIGGAGGSGERAMLVITRRRLAAAGLFGIVLATVIGIVVVNRVRFDDDVQVIAHRGASAVAPENTMAAVRRAIQDGADWVEIDVQETADGEVVVFHDSDFMKQAGRDLKIWNARFADLEQIDIGSRFGPEYQAERVPTLAQVLNECKGKVGVNIELKYYGHDQQLEQRVVEIVETAGVEREVIFMSLKLEAVEKLKSLRPDWKVGLLMSVSAGSLADIDADFLAVNGSFANQIFIRTAHSLDKEVYVWTINDAVTMSAMIGRGVDGLITDDPALARSVIMQRQQMTHPERLMLHLAELFGLSKKIGEQ